MFAAAALGLCLNLLLAYLKFQGSDIAGCGGAGDCEAVLSSRWSEILGIPLPTLGALLYLILLAAFVRKWQTVEWLAYGAILGAAVWLTFVQATILQRFCPWCMAAHSIGLAVAVSGILYAPRDRRVIACVCGGCIAAAALAALQVFGPVPQSSAVAPIASSENATASDIHATGKGRKVHFDNGRKTYDVAALPHLGPPDAQNVLVEYFDFLCPACHRMQDHLAELIEAWPGKICVIILPVPLERGCHASLPANEPGHPGSCEISRIALAVWRVDASVYPALHRRFMAEPQLDPAAALAIARASVDSAALDVAMQDPWIDKILRANIADWDRYAGQPKILPQLLLNAGRILHGIPPGRDAFFSVMEQELQLRPNRQ